MKVFVGILLILISLIGICVSLYDIYLTLINGGDLFWNYYTESFNFYAILNPIKEFVFLLLGFALVFNRRG